ncbi:pyridoxamine 5'-phosphate oxidase [Fretibacter rubidus]|uniref:pyridoxamine 5'-phosphate oxidase n=1 Tax=Fretibacter rubidus TaxID=570162 RepID=UPI00352B272B
MPPSVIPPTPTDSDYAARKRDYVDHPMFMSDDPIDLFEQWLSEAGETEPNDPNAMTVATVDPYGLPDARILLLKGVDAKGFVFFTNDNSDKGEQLKTGKKAALCFHWKTKKRQVRVRGPVAQVSKKESDDYFASRARGSQIGAWASDQSSVISSREVLLDQIEAVETRFDGRSIVRPPHWNGWRVKPLSIEFWEDGAFRLHDRRRFHRARIGARWQSERLSP